MKTKPNIGKRILAGLIDYTIIYGFAFALIFMLGKPNEDGIYSLSGAPAFIPVVFWFIVTVGFENVFGATLGNKAVGLKAVPLNRQSNNLTFGQSLKRHLLDPIDMFFFGIVGILTINNTDRNQRLGDLWAGTIVIKVKELKEKG